MADLATLKIAVDSRPVDQASNDLDELATSANRAEKATAGLTNQTKATGAAMAGMNNAVRQAKAAQEAAAQAMGGVAGRTKLASHEITNLAFQFQDLGVQIAGGANPLTAFVQQGSQISGIMMQSGMSVGAFTKAVLGMIASTTAAVVMNPVFLGIAAAVGTVTAAVNFMADDITKASGVTVTAGDVMLGAFDVIKKAIKTQVSAAFEAMGIDTAKVWSNVVEYTRKAVNIIIGAATLAPRTIITAFRVLPSGIADAFYSAVNFGIRAINGLLERSVSAINNFLDAVNPILEKAGLGIGRLTTPRIAELQNNYAGAAAKAANAFVQVARETIERDYVGDIGKALKDAAVSQALKRQAEEGGRNVGKKMGKSAAGEFKDTLAKELADLNLDVMNGMTDTMREVQETISAINAGDVAELQDELAKKSQARADAFKKEAEERAKANEELRETVDYLDNLLGLQGGMGRLFNALKSGFGDAFKSISDTFAKLRDGLAGSLAKLGTSFKEIAGGAAIGGIAAQATGGSAVGGTIGGGIGQALGSKFLGKALGSFAGPLGSIAGGLLGGLIGGLFTKTKQASATLSSIGGQAVVSGIKGNDAQLKGIANNMANGLLKGIANIAEQLGGQLGGAVSLSIGQRKKDFVVDPTGQGRTKGAGVINFGEDQAAAIAYATQLAIQQGIITGLSAGANALIKMGGDLQTQIDKAMQFDKVFEDLKAETNPLFAELGKLADETNKLIDIFREAGASTEEFAALYELFEIKKRKAIFEAERPRRELEIRLIEASGDAAGALAAKRRLELEAMDASLQGLQRAIYAYEDLAAANDKVATAQANLATAIENRDRAAREAQIKAKQAQIEGIRTEIAALDKVIAGRDTAKQALRAAYDAEMQRIDGEIANRQRNIQSLESAYQAQASVIQGTIDKFRGFATSLRDFAATLIPLNSTGPASIETLRKKFVDLVQQGLGGNEAAMGQATAVGGQLRESIMANAADRTAMLRDLYALQYQTTQFARQADQQASIAEQQLAVLRSQYDAMIAAEQAAIAKMEADKIALTTQVEQFISLGDKVLTVDEAIKQLQTAEAAALEAEAQRTLLEGQIVQLEAQIAALQAVGEQVMSVEQAQAELASAQAERDAILAEIDRAGFFNVVDQLRSTEAAIVSAIGASAAQTAAAAAASAAINAPNYSNVIPFPTTSPDFLGGGWGGRFMDNLQIQQFANGGLHNGGLRIVGENGPELEATGPSRIYNANQLSGMMGGGATAEEVKALREELKLAMYQIAKNTGKSYDLMNRWDGDGLPETRDVAA